MRIVRPSTVVVAAATVTSFAVLSSTIVVTASSTTNDKNAKNDDDNNDNNNNIENKHRPCGLYLAESSTSTTEEPKLGVFAGKDIEAGMPIGSGDLAIHTFHLMANNLWVDPKTDEIVDDLDENPLANLVDWFEQYIWVPHSSGGQFELSDPSGRIITAIPGTGVMGAYDPKLTNADWNHSSAYHRPAWNEVPGRSHPGRGAYTNYYNLELASVEVIPAGKEIFVGEFFIVVTIVSCLCFVVCHPITTRSS